jgi:lysophospholipase L1-like esterase
MIALAEGFLRTFPGLFSEETRQYLSSTPANSGVAHPYIGHLQTPNRTMVFAGKDFKAIHHVDAFGFRNTWPWPERVDVVALGDSLTYGFGVGDEEAWPAIVSRRTETSIINLGLVGASSIQYLRVYETFGVKLHPKLLLVGVYAHNDFWDAGMFHLWLTAGVGDNYMAWRNFGRPLRFTFSLRDPMGTAEGVFRTRVYPLIRSSHLYNLLRAIRGGSGAEVVATKTLTFADGSRLRLDPNDFRYLTDGAQPDDHEFRLVLDGLRKIHSMAATQGTRVLLVLLPGKEEIYLPLAGEDAADPAGPLRQALDNEGIEYLDLAPVFRARAEAGQRLFFEVDSHPNEVGYALIGESVASHIDKNAAAYGLRE